MLITLELKALRYEQKLLYICHHFLLLCLQPLTRGAKIHLMRGSEHLILYKNTKILGNAEKDGMKGKNWWRSIKKLSKRLKKENLSS